VAASRITVALPGVDVPARQRAVSSGPPKLLAVGAVTPRKGYDVLVAALATLRDTEWSLTIVGARDRSPETVSSLKRQVEAAELSPRITLAGAITPDALAELYANADLFVLASHFEGYGMAYAEAIAHGLPVVGTTAGAIPDTVPADAAILVPPGDVTALAAALRRLITRPAERERLAGGAVRAASGLPTWQDAAAIISNTLEALS
jgi:glycosyltransferase involved in cell wall biosynthesis